MGSRGERRTVFLDPRDAAAARQIIDLLNDALPGYPRSEQWLLWKHAQNPAGPSIVAGSFDSRTGRLVAVRIFWKMMVRRGDRVFVAFQPCDTATSADFRRRGLFRALTEAALDKACELGGQVVFNFPNRYSGPGNLKLGWQEIDGLRRWVKPMSWGTGVAALRKRGRLGRFQDRDEEGHQARADEGWPHQVPWPPEVVHGDRESAFLDWRFTRHPRYAYRMISTSDAGLVGRLGHRGRLRELFVVSWLGRATQSPRAVHDLLRLARERYDPALVTTYLSSGHPLRNRLLRQGFLPTPSRIPCLARGLVDPERWIDARWALESTDKDTH